MNILKKMVPFVVLASSLNSEVLQLSPLCEEEQHFLHYRMLHLETDILYLEMKIDSLKEYFDSETFLDLKLQVAKLKFQIGLPVNSEDLGIDNE